MGKLGLDIDKGLYLGIDFGTTNSVISVYNYDDNQVYTVPIEGSLVCPTAIAFDEDFDDEDKLEKVCGLQAKEGAVIYPDSTILGIKRLITLDQSIPVIVEGKKYDFDPVQIAGEIISYLKDQADAYVREQFGINGIFNGCVITVPANSVDKQKKRMKEAASFAGFHEDEVHIRLEPAAAAISYATTVSDTKHVLVYDFGGGTFDACVLKIEAKTGEPTIQILSTYGDNVLGGNDIDKIMMDMIYAEFCELTNHTIDLFDLSKDDGLSRKQKLMALARLNQVATGAKERLSVSKSTKVVMAPFIQEPEIININMEITVEAFLNHRRSFSLGDPDDIFEKMKDKNVLDLAGETIKCTDICLQSGGIEKSVIDEIFLVGGSSSIPVISMMIKEQYGLEPYQSKISPALSISNGAAIYCHMIMQPSSNDVLISEKTIHSFGIEMAGRKYLEIIPAGIDIPDEGLTICLDEPLETNFDGLTSMVIVVYENMIPRDKNALAFVYEEGMKRLTGTSLKGIPSAPKGQEKVQITFHLSKDYILGVTAKSLSNEGVQTMLSVDALY